MEVKGKTEILKPCPFCGSIPVTYWDRENELWEGYNEGFNIVCPCCEISRYAIDKEDAIEGWNTRR